MAVLWFLRCAVQLDWPSSSRRCTPLPARPTSAFEYRRNIDKDLGDRVPDDEHTVMTGARLAA